MENNIPFRHGDWNFIPIDVDAAGAAEPPAKRFVFGEGEGVGHLHVAVADRPGSMQWHKDGDGWIAKILEPVALEHPQHSMKLDIIVPPGTYRVVRRREKDWFSGSVRRIVD